MDRYYDAERIVRLAFAPWAKHYRKTRRALYRKVDRILRNPNRQSRQSGV